MAEEEQTIVDGAPEEESSGGGGKSKIMLLAIVGVAAAVVGIVVALFVIKPMMADSPQDDATHEVADESDGHGGDSDGKKDSHAKGAGGSVLYAIEDIIVNPAGTGGTRFLSVSFGLELGNGELAKQIEDREPIVRDALITILASKTVAQLTDAKQKEITRYQIKKRLENLLATKELKGVYYTDFVLQ